MTEEEHPPEEQPPAEPPAEQQAPGEDPNILIDKAVNAAERLENANKELEKLLDKQARMKVEETLGGTAIAGTHKPTEEEKEIEGAKKLLEGTGFEDELFPKKE